MPDVPTIALKRAKHPSLPWQSGHAADGLVSGRNPCTGPRTTTLQTAAAKRTARHPRYPPGTRTGPGEPASSHDPSPARLSADAVRNLSSRASDPMTSSASRRPTAPALRRPLARLGTQPGTPRFSGSDFARLKLFSFAGQSGLSTATPRRAFRGIARRSSGVTADRGVRRPLRRAHLGALRHRASLQGAARLDRGRRKDGRTRARTYATAHGPRSRARTRASSRQAHQPRPERARGAGATRDRVSGGGAGVGRPRR